MNKITHILIAAAMLLASCAGSNNTANTYDGEAYTPRHAKGFAIYRSGEHSSVIAIKNPWQGAENITTELFVSRNGEKPPKGFSGQQIAAPLKSVVCMSSTYVAFIDAIGEIDAVKGVSGAKFISNPTILDRHGKGEVKDVGFDANINYELLASLKPDIVFIYGVAGENTATTNKMRELGITVIYIGDYLENTPLGKSEWIVPFGEMFDKTEEAKAVFGSIADRYEALKELVASNSTARPKVMLNAPYRDVWFVPGDRSYMVSLINDAGGAYLFAGTDNAVSRPISGEVAYATAVDADCWLNPNQATTIKEVIAQNNKFGNINAVKSRQVYNCTKRNTPSGGSDFWESGALRADRVLEDIILIFHPDLLEKLGSEPYVFEMDLGKFDRIKNAEQAMYYFERLK